MKKKLMCVLLSMAIVIAYSVPCFAEGEIGTEEKEISNIEEFKDAIQEEADDGSGLTHKEETQLLNEVEPEVLDEYVEEVDEIAFSKMEKMDPIVEYNPVEDKTIEKYEIEIDPLTSVEMEFGDQEELSTVGKAMESIQYALVTPVYAAYNGQEIWKEYKKNGGKEKRYCYGKFTRSVGSGKVTFIGENHYFVSSAGITERYGKIWVDSMKSVTVKASNSDSDYSIMGGSATKAGDKCSVVVRQMVTQTDYLGFFNHQWTIYEKLGIKYVEKDKKNHRIKVQFSWSKYEY